MGWIDALYIAALVFANGFFVAAEFAIVKVRISQIDQLALRGQWSAKLTSRVLDHLDAYLSASQLGITVASLALGEAIHTRIQPALEAAFAWFGVPPGPFVIWGVSIAVVPLLALSLVTFLHMALGEQAPKNLAIRSPRPVALATVPILVAFTYAFWPVIWLLNTASNWTLRILGLYHVDNAELVHTEEELRHILGESVAGGTLKRSERVMIENVLTLEEKTARRVMVPRSDIVYLSLARSVDDNLRLARQTGHTRFPLCEDDLTTVIGMIHVKDLFRAGAVTHGRPDLRELKRPLPLLSESMHLDELLVEFQHSRFHLALVLDEFGNVSGMVTLENVLEELVGPIQDEFDRESPRVRTLGGGVFEVDATCPLDVLEGDCGLVVPETDAETAGGLILDVLGYVAKPGDHIDIDHHRLIVVQADPTRIRRIRIEPITPDPAAKDNPAPTPLPESSEQRINP